MLDIEVAGAVAPDAAIVVYFAPNTDQGFIDAVSQAVHDTTHTPSVVSISWGESEDAWTAQARTQMEQILTEAGGLGVTVTVAAGDNGSADSVTDGQQHVDFPASAPHALACGGTTLQASGATISSETVWSTPDHGTTGGGVSRQFPLPSYQSAAKVPDNVDSHADRPRGPGRVRRRQPRDRIQDPRRRLRSDGGRDERRRAAVGGADRAAQPVPRRSARASPSRACIRCWDRRPSTTSPRATTAPTAPARGGTRAPDSARPTAPQLAARLGAGSTGSASAH